MNALPAAAPTSQSPLDEVWAAISAGAHSRREIAARTTLGEEFVDAVLEHLVRTGQLAAEALSFGCPPTGCGGCPSKASETCGGPAQPGGAGQRQGLLVLSRPRSRPGE